MTTALQDLLAYLDKNISSSKSSGEINRDYTLRLDMMILFRDNVNSLMQKERETHEEAIFEAQDMYGSKTFNNLFPTHPTNKP